MKKALLGTSAIALASAFATSAHAVDWEVKVGGYMEQYAAYAAPDVDGITGDKFSGVDSKMDAEIFFLPSITLDNGLKIGANVQLEGNTDGDQIDESYLFIDGSFGRVLLGSENSAGYLMHYGAPDVTFVNVNSGSLGNWIPFSGTVTGVRADNGSVDSLGVGNNIFRGTLGSTYLENGANNDAQRFTYFTPRFAGFQLGASYARDPRQDDQQQLNLDVQEAGLHNIFDVGANYVNSFGGFDLAVSGRWGIATNDDDDLSDTFSDNPQVWAAGLNVGYMGFTVGGSFGEQNNFGNLDGTAWDAGVAYETGPWGISFTYFRGKNVDNENFVPGVLSADEKLQQYLLGLSYTLAKGVAVNAFGAYVDFNEELGDAGGPNELTGDDVDGWVVGTGIKISF